MKVVCIADLSGVVRNPKCIDTNLPIEDNIYIVTGVYYGGSFYRLKEFEDIYSVKFFATLDDYLDQFTANLVEELENC